MNIDPFNAAIFVLLLGFFPLVLWILYEIQQELVKIRKALYALIQEEGKDGPQNT